MMASKGRSPKKLEKSDSQTSLDFTIPKEIIVKPSEVCEGELGAWCKIAIPEDKLFGPFKGVLTFEEEYKSVNMRYAWEVYNLDTNKLHHMINATDPYDGNWMRNVNCARFLEEQNIVSVQKGWDIYYKAMKDIKPGEELLTWYSMKKRRRRRQKKDSIETGDPLQDTEILQTVAMMEKMESVSEVSGRRRKVPRRFLEEQDFIPFKKVKRKLSSEKPESVEKVNTSESTDKKDLTSEYKVAEKSLNANEKPGIKVKQDTHTATSNNVFPEPEEILSSNSDNEFNDINSAAGTVPNPQSTTTLPNGGRDVSEIMEELKVQPELGKYQFDIQRVSELTSKGEKVYRCDICLGIYRHPFSLKRHFLRNHIYCRYLCETDISNCMINVAQQIKSIAIAMKDDIQKLNGTVKPSEEHLVYSERLDEETGLITTEEETEFIPQFLPGVFRCNTCYRLFDTLEEITTHTKEHPVVSNKSFACEKCDLKFSYQQNLERHRLSHLSSSLVCHLCGRDFPSQFSLNKHLFHHSGRGLLQCKHCPTQCQNVGLIRKHMLREHPEVMKAKARKREELKNLKSNNKSNTSNEVKNRVSAKGNIKNKPGIKKSGGLHCRHCTVVCSNLGQMKQHLCREHKEEVSKHMSRKGKTITPLKQAASKVKAKIAGNNKGFPYLGKLNCKHCDVICKHIGQLRKHMCLYHKEKLKPRRSRCRDDKLTFPKMKSTSTTKVASAVSSNNKNKPATEFQKTGLLSCKYCDLKFPHVGAIRQHLCYVHPETVKRTRTPRHSVDNRKQEVSKKKSSTERKSEKKDTVVCNNGRKKNSAFTFACVICKKRFDTYSNMCRHRTMKHVIGEGMDAGVKTSHNPQKESVTKSQSKPILESDLEVSDDEFIEMKGPFIAVEDYCPKKPSEFYANIPYNIANNLNNYIDGRPESLRKFKKYIRIKEYKSINNLYEILTDEPSECWEKFNFPKGFSYKINRLGELCSVNINKNLIHLEESVIADSEMPLGQTRQNEMSNNCEVSSVNLNGTDTKVNFNVFSNTLDSNKEEKTFIENNKNKCGAIDLSVKKEAVESNSAQTGALNPDIFVSGVANTLNACATRVENGFKVERFKKDVDTQGTVSDFSGTTETYPICTKSKFVTEGNVTIDECPVYTHKYDECECETAKDNEVTFLPGILHINEGHGKSTSLIEREMVCSKQAIETSIGCKIVYSEDDFVVTQNLFHDSAHSLKTNSMHQGEISAMASEVTPDEMPFKLRISGKVESGNENPFILQNSVVEGQAADSTFQRDTDVMRSEMTSDSCLYQTPDCQQQIADRAEAEIELNHPLDLSTAVDTSCVAMNFGDCFTQIDSHVKNSERSCETFINADVDTEIMTSKKFGDTPNNVTCATPLSESTYSCLQKNDVSSTEPLTTHQECLTARQTSYDSNVVKSTEDCSLRDLSDSSVIRSSLPTDACVVRNKRPSDEQLDNDRSDDNRSLPSLDLAPLDRARNSLSSSRSISPSSVYSQPPDLECQLENFSEDSCSNIDSVQLQSPLHQHDSDKMVHKAGLPHPLDLTLNVDTLDTSIDKTDECLPIFKHLNLRRNVPFECKNSGSWYAKRQLFPTISQPVEIPLSPRFSPQPCYDKIKFGQNGEINYVCSVCLKSFKDPDRIGRHQTKWHPSLQCGQLNVELGHYIEFLHYMFPTSEGIISSSQYLADTMSICSNFTCTKCFGTFKNVGRLHVHIVNCDPKGLYKKETPVKSEGENVSLSDSSYRTKLKEFSDTEIAAHNKKLQQCNQLKTMKNEVPEKNKKHKNYELLYNPHQHVRRRELIELVDTHQCSGCGVKFKTLSLLERHAKNCTKKEEFSNLKPRISSCINNFLSNTRHVCHYCSKYFTYPKFLSNHYQNFCHVKKEKISKNALSADDRAAELAFQDYLKSQEEVKFPSEKDDNDVEDELRRWTKIVKKRSRRKNHSWTSIKKKKSSVNISGDTVNTDIDKSPQTNHSADSQSETDNPDTVALSPKLCEKSVDHLEHDNCDSSYPTRTLNFTEDSAPASFAENLESSSAINQSVKEHDSMMQDIKDNSINESQNGSLRYCDINPQSVSDLQNVNTIVDNIRNSPCLIDDIDFSEATKLLKPSRPTLMIDKPSRNNSSEFPLDESSMSDISR